MMSSAVSAASPVASSTSIPNFSSNGNVGWLAAGPLLTPTPNGPQPVGVDPAHRFSVATALFTLVDATNPNLQPWVADVLRRQNQGVLAGTPIQQPTSASCFPAGIPLVLQEAVQPLFFIQRPHEILILHQLNHEVRRISLDRQHSSRPKPSWFGESVGHYENGDTLVVDTIGLNDKTFVDFWRTPHTLDLHVVEHWKLVEDGNAIEVKVRFDDPGAFKSPYEVTQRFRKVEGPLLEYACAENPVRRFDEAIGPIAQADKPDF